MGPVPHGDTFGEGREEGVVTAVKSAEPEIRAEITLGKQVVEMMLHAGTPATRQVRALAAAELIAARVSEAYGLDGAA